MDQSELLVILGGLYDKLVSDVAAKVVARDQATIESIIGEWANRNLHDIDKQISNWMSNDNNLRDKVMDVLANEDDIDDQISNWMSNNFDLDNYSVDDAIESWMDNNLDDKVYDAVNSLTLIVEVSR
jgi:hypothetical protein